MKLKTIALASAAVVALSTGAFAKSNAKADAQEALITQQLNLQQAAAPGTMPSQDTAQTQASSEIAADSTAPVTAPMAANDNANTGTVMQKDSTAPKTDLGKATTAAGNEIDQASMAKNPVTPAELKSAVSLSAVSSETLKTAEVKNRDGLALGEVNSVRVSGAGQVEAVNAEVGGFLGVGERVVALDASNLVYIKSRNLVVTSLTKDQIGKLPPITQ